MNQAFENNIKMIHEIMRKRIFYTNIVFYCLTLVLISFILFFNEHKFYIILTSLLLLMTLVIKYFFYHFVKNLNKLLNTYQDNKQDVIDYLKIILKNAEYTTHHFIMRHFYQNIIYYYIEALEALKKDCSQ